MHKDTKILVTGVKGQLGYDITRELRERGFSNVCGIDIDDLDIANENDVHVFLNKIRPSIVIHAAAWTSVDKAEQMPEKVYEVNAMGTKYIAESCKEINATMVYISTDYVFDGKGTTPFEVDDPKNGLSVYGKSKSLGEDYVTFNLSNYYIIRTSWVFGINGNNFVKTMLSLAKKGKKEFEIVNDQVGSPTYTRDLSSLICNMVATNKYGIYHATNDGYCSWSEFAKAIFEFSNIKAKVIPISTEDYRKMVSNQANRPLNSRLSKMSLVMNGFSLLPTWQVALINFLKELKENG